MLSAKGKVRKRRKSYSIPGHAHELTFSCYRSLPLLGYDRTREWFMEALDRARRTWDFEIWGYVIMPEHAHVLLFPRSERYDIGSILKAIKQPIARRAIRFLKTSSPEKLQLMKVIWPSGRTEHRFWQQGGGYDRNITDPRTARASVDYIHNNPVRRGLVDSPAEWEWSSARWYAGEEHVKLAIDGLPPEPLAT